ncbi:EamA family transporter RarD [Rhodosalinus sp.]|uniref:EamA family transporter RarD n=1 Tax=Rhodosalinus sp. TaxID=2047741 RepID=UPI003978F2AD
MGEPARGVASMVAACTIWGLSALYYKLLDHVPPLEVLAHRTLWSFAFFAVVLGLRGRLRMLFAAIDRPGKAVRILAAAFFISCNWFLFILSVQTGHVTEASLGYYIFPLVAVLLGFVVFGERLGRAQWMAVALAAAAVLVLTLGNGVAPWIALALAATFGLYGLMKKRLAVGPVVSVTAEVLLLSPVALAVLWVYQRDGGAYGASLGDSLLLMLSGPLTAVPLMLFAYAARRVTYVTVGLVQYLNPTLQFLVAVAIFGEPFGAYDAIAFPLIWTALAIYSLATLSRERAARRAVTPSSADPTGVMRPRSEGAAKP